MKYEFSRDIYRVKFLREAACVQRTHADPALGDHSVGKHSFNMVTMLLILWPEAPRDLILACVKHDIPERVTGDMPYQAKRSGIQNHLAQEDAERTINIGLFGNHEERELDELCTSWLAGLDMLEFYCYCKDQMMMGNRSISTKLFQAEKALNDNQHLYPVEILDMFYEIKNDDWFQMPDGGGR